MERTRIGAARLYLPDLTGRQRARSVRDGSDGLVRHLVGCFRLARGAPDPIAANAGDFVCLLPVELVNLIIGHPFETAPVGMLLAVISGGIATGFGYIVWYLAVRDLPVLHAATVQLSLPALVALGGMAFLSEPITARLLVASAAMLGGIALVLGRRSQPQTAS